MQLQDEIQLKKEIGKLIQTRRKAIKLSQEELAEKLEIKTRTLSKIENGHTMFSAKTLYKLCMFFNLPPMSFFDFGDDSSLNETKLNDIINKIKSGGDDKINFYYELVNIIENKK